MATETSPPPLPAHSLHSASNGNIKPGESYSVPQAAEAVFRRGILANPSIQKDLPEGYEDYAAPVSFKGSANPCIPINWRFAESVSALNALEGTLVNALLAKKYGLEPQKIEINTDHAQLFFMSPLLWKLKQPSGEILDFTSFANPNSRTVLDAYFPNFDFHGDRGGFGNFATNIYQTADDRFFHLHGSLNSAPSIKSVGLTPEDGAAKRHEEQLNLFQEAMRKIDSADMQQRASEVYKQAGTICWTTEEFRDSEHGKANAHVGLFEIHDAPPAPAQKPCWWPSSPQTSPSRPLAGLKVVDMTRIIAAPAITRGLAELGASIMRVTAPHLPDMSSLHPDLNWGKWNCQLDLRRDADRETLRALILDADVLVTGYRPGVMERHGFGPDDVFKLCATRGRGIVVARENCYGWSGPWAERSGWQQISDANTGVSYEFGRAMGHDEPVTPVFPNSDYCTGLAGVCGVLTALLRRGERGGSFRVDLALNYYSRWLVDSVGTYPPGLWDDLWARNGGQVFRHYHNMQHLLPTYLRMLHTPGAPGNVLFNPDFFEDRECTNLGEKSEGGGKVVFTAVKPILRFPAGAVKPGFHIGTRGNGADAAKWPEDLTTQVVR